MNEPRVGTIVVRSEAQAVEVRDYLNSAGVEWSAQPASFGQATVLVTASSGQWSAIEEWLDRAEGVEW